MARRLGSEARRLTLRRGAGLSSSRRDDATHHRDAASHARARGARRSRSAVDDLARSRRPPLSLRRPARARASGRPRCSTGASPKAAPGAGSGRSASSRRRTIIGCVGLMPISVGPSTIRRCAGLVEPIVALAPASWDRGHAVEALRAARRLRVRHARPRELAGATDVPNEASHRMLCAPGSCRSANARDRTIACAPICSRIRSRVRPPRTRVANRHDFDAPPRVRAMLIESASRSRRRSVERLSPSDRRPPSRSELRSDAHRGRRPCRGDAFAELPPDVVDCGFDERGMVRDA